MLAQLTEKAKNDVDQLKRDQEDEIKRVEDEYFSKIEEKIKKIN